MKSLAYLCTAALTLALFVLAAPGQATAQGADDPSQVAAGETVYMASCAGCHGAEGEGVSGLGRPLTGIASQGDRATHVASVADGKGNMPAFGSRLSEGEIDSAISYVRLTFVAPEATTTSSETELALTGVNSNALAALGAAFVLTGAGVVRWSRKES